jgi:hypothetical protein
MISFDPNSNISPHLMFLYKDFKRGVFFLIIQNRRLETRYGHTADAHHSIQLKSLSFPQYGHQNA